MLWTEV